jgi:hypothetical protein
MARAVLASLQILSAIFAIAVPGSACRAQAQANQHSPSLQAEMSPSGAKELHEFRKRVESGSFYAEMVRRLGKPQSCENRKDQQEMHLTCVFRENGRLQARTNSAIEFSEQRMDLQHINAKSAVALLKDAERHSYGRHGCGIAWNRPITESAGEHADSREVVYRGDVCNCQASVLYDHNSVVALVLRSAC